MNEMYLHSLLLDRERAKLAEELAVAVRRSIDDKIVEVVGTTDEGTINQESGSKRVIVNFKLDRKITSPDELSKNWALMPPHVQACFRQPPRELSLRQYRDLQTTDAKSFEIISAWVTAKPARPSITIEDFTPTGVVA